MAEFSFVQDRNGKVLGLWVADRGAIEQPGLLEALLARQEQTAGLLGQPRRVVPNSYDNKGGFFVMFGSTPAPGEASGDVGPEGKPADKLFIGMSIEAAVGILGEPSARVDAGAMLGMYRKVSVSAEAKAALGKKELCLWRRPEGEYNLVFEDGKLAQIHSVPK